MLKRNYYYFNTIFENYKNNNIIIKNDSKVKKYLTPNKI